MPLLVEVWVVEEVRVWLADALPVTLSVLELEARREGVEVKLKVPVVLGEGVMDWAHTKRGEEPGGDRKDTPARNKKIRKLNIIIQ